MKSQRPPTFRLRSVNLNSLVRVVMLVGLIALIGIPLFSSSSASSWGRTSKAGNSKAVPATDSGRADSKQKPVFAAKQLFNPLLPTTSFPLMMPQATPTPSIATFDGTGGTCGAAKVEFNLGQEVCATATATGGSAARRRITWQDPDGFVRQSTAITTDPQSDQFTIPTDPTTTLSNGQVANNIGNWRVNLVGRSLVTYTTFVVKDPLNATADLSVTKIASSNSQQVAAGSNGSFDIYVQNGGPDDAATVTVIDHVPDNTMFVTMIQTSPPQTPNPTEPAFTCTTVPDGNGNITCSINTFATGASATFSFVYTVNAGTPAGTSITNTVGIASATTNEANNADNSSAASATVAGSGTPTCTLDCPEDINAIANTTEGSQRGAHITFAVQDAVGTCGAITATPASGSFFPVGTTVVSVTSETGGGSCSFAVTIEDQGIDPPTISCPASPLPVDANNDCEATVAIVNPTVSGNNVTFSGVRSDGKPLYNCDCFPHNPDPDPNADVWECDIHGTCTRRADAPFASGVTTITWTAHSHDIAGPYASPDAEEAHRTGAASCTVTITVNDVTPPVITAVDQTVSADASCQAAVPDYGNSVSDNCACAASDTSQDCIGQHRITTTQDVAAGAMVGLGPHTIHVTANDGSSNNGGAGNTTNKTIIFTVNDTTAPTITCPANILNVHTDPGICAATVNPGAATASDNCSTPTIVGVRSDSQPLSALYPKGTTTITWTATDAAGNHSSCIQTITVIDVEPPTISCQANIIADFDPAVNGAVVTYTTPVGNDNCPGAITTRTTGLASGSTFPTGTTTNTFVVTDASGNTASCSFKVTVALTSLIGLDSVTISGSGYADSYSSAGGYPATKSSLVNVLSNGTITIGGSGKVWGNVRSTRTNVNMTGSAQVTGNATAGTTVTTSGSASVGGTRTNNALAPVMTLPPVPPCGPPYSSASGISGTYSYNATTGDLTLSGVNIATLANGNYCFHNVTLGNSSQLKVNGLVVIKMTGTLNTSGSSNLNNTTQIPSNLRILSSYSGTNGVTIGNSVSVYALIYAPTTGLNLSGSAPLFGTFAGKALIIGNSGAIHYDTQLKAIWPDVWALL